jgi:peptidoglycan/xylan/chitin deacetylase (PgdA/CDA1 family)
MAAIELGRASNKLQPNCRTSPYLAYHEITEAESEYLYGISRGQFKEHLCCVQRLATANRSGSTLLHITFDDGHVSQYDQAFSVLQELSMKATFFVTAGWTGKRPGYMTWKQLAELARYGHEVQSHGWSHTLLTQCSAKELQIELLRSKQALEDHLGAKVSAISLPGGRWNTRVLEACRESGYEQVLTSDPWKVSEDVMGLQIAGRWMVTRTMSAQRIQFLLNGKGATLYLLRARHFAKETAKLVLGDSAYRSLWRTLANKAKSQEDTRITSDSAKRPHA